ncbi:angiogenic factor with G patch and FHA domains 1-like isoform X1 [Mercenaria mercenaria]|uniref:angiogenic factor with G patch and FHA domains 1-like isoform X1 n=1 Tax=Mercenaria mercenaria TaxID=6596 RepID=UPI00234EA98E|nr:angiogenic factor with G patch and FHA domains 1-like isoform X1 [Mercenaria mercenaria]XP_045215757.2 angiogenic factor with G patch and FHA domains 1-like isoform X1 [Mercenaria mercenaria]XP_045215758.2 angiogenic factor with G patch and FHA domains 1-like isoform X1 [Mercenaria mercenaria]XP_045215759.2 angiogenic factor with G patch and FHA domains 1-like isoform X1 [Mercenaria mercenaria]
MTAVGKLTDTELLGLISQTTQGSPNVAFYNNQEHEVPAQDKVNDVKEEKLKKTNEHLTPALELEAERPDVQADTLTLSDAQSHAKNSSADFNLELSQSVLQSSLIVPHKSETVSFLQAGTQSDLTFPVLTVSQSEFNTGNSLRADTQSVSAAIETVSSAKDVTQSAVNSQKSTVLHFQMSSESGSQVSSSSIRLVSPTDIKSPSYKLDAELVSMLSQEEIINLVHEYRTEVEITKKKLERSERQLTKANNYNDVLRNMVEKLSSEIHQVKHGKTCSVHVQVDKDDFLAYTTGRNTMPNWNNEDEQISMPMETSQTPEVPVVATSERTSTQQPGVEMETVSIADSIKQAAEAAVQQQQADMLHDQGYVYDEHSGLYYHSATGYYYDQHKSLFYDPKSGIYYYFDYDTGEYLFHSQIELTSQTTEQSAVKVDVPAEKKKLTKTPKKNRSRERYSSGENIFKNRKERRRAEQEYRSKQRRQHRDDRYGQSDKRERGRKRRRRNDHTDSGDSDRRRDRRSVKSHDRDKIRKTRTSRNRSERKHEHRKDGKASKSHIEERSVQNIDDDQVKKSKVDNKGKRTKCERSIVHKHKSRSKSEENTEFLEKDKHDTEITQPGDLESSLGNSQVKREASDHTNSADEYELESENELMIVEDENEGIYCEVKSNGEDDDVIHEGQRTAFEMENKNEGLHSRNEKSRRYSHRGSRSERRRHHHKKESREIYKSKSSHSEDSASEIESGELSDTDSDHASFSKSCSSYLSISSGEELYVDLVEDDEHQAETEVAGSYPPCIRVMVTESEYLQIGTLYIVTCTGAKIGRENCDICVPDVNVSKVHAEIRYNQSASQYEIFDLASQNGTFLNSQRLSPAKIASEPFALSHDDNLLISTTKLLCHIHTGYDTCDQCEPGVVIATHKAHQPQTEMKVMTKEERLRQKKQELNQIKKKYGLKNSAYEDNTEVFNNPNYTNKAEERRKFVGSDVPGQKQEAPASVHRPISTGNIGHKMLQKMGWKEGDTLGKNNTGIQEPISVTLRASQKAGLGSASAGAFSADDVSTVDMKKANRRIQAQERYKQIESEKCNNEGTASEKQWTQGDSEFT